MLFRLVSPLQRKGTRNVQLVKRIPSDLRKRAVGMVLAIPLGEQRKLVTITSSTDAVRVSLGTADPATARVRQGEALAYIEQVFSALRVNSPVTLTHRQIVALSGRLYRSWAGDEQQVRSTSITIDPVTGERVEDEGDLPDEAEAVYASFIDYLEREKAKGEPEKHLERMLGPLVNRLLLAEGIADVDRTNRPLLLLEFWRALRDAMELRLRQAGGDYSPDPKAERFPEWAPLAADGRPRPKSSLKGLLQDWWREAQKAGRRQSTYVNYKGAINKLGAFLKHDDAARITKQDLLRFKDHRLGEVSARTVKDNDLSALKSVFGWAVANDKLPANPAEGVTVMRDRPQKLRDKSFRPEEVKAILGAALREHHAAKHWVPWLLAYTGARVGEIGQLRRQDVVKREGEDHWSIVITPEAGTVKTNEARTVPLHPHLVELGFVEFAKKATGATGHLFIRPNRKTGDVLGPLKGMANHLREFVREHVPDPNVQPNHAWRHLFITACRRHGIDEGMQHYLTGHSPTTVHESYGEPAGLYEAVCKLPRFEVA